MPLSVWAIAQLHRLNMPSASSNEANQFVTSPKASGACPKPRKRAATCAGVVASLAIPWTCTRNQEGIPHKELPEFLDFQLFGTTLLVVNKQPFCWTIWVSDFSAREYLKNAPQDARLLLRALHHGARYSLSAAALAIGRIF